MTPQHTGGGATRADVRRLLQAALSSSGSSSVPVEFVALRNDFIADINYATHTLFPAWNTTPIFNQGGFGVSNTGVTVPSTGIYLVSYSILCTTGASTGNRLSLQSWVGINGTLTTNGPSSSNYIRNQEGHNKSDLVSPAFPFQLSAGDSIGVVLKRIITSTATPIKVDPDQSFLFVQRFQ